MGYKNPKQDYWVQIDWATDTVVAWNQMNFFPLLTKTVAENWVSKQSFFVLKLTMTA